jgi:hypothetical protein
MTVSNKRSQSPQKVCQWRFLELLLNSSVPYSSERQPTEVCDEIIKPQTNLFKCSCVSFLQKEEPILWVDETEVSQKSAAWRPGMGPDLRMMSSKKFFGQATNFVSHAWAKNFLDLMDSLECWWDNSGGEGTFFWLDIFVNNQHGTSSRPLEWWETAFRSSVMNIGHTIIVFSPWQSPVYVQRAWCLFELYTTIDSNTNYDIILTASQREEFIVYLKNDLNPSKRDCSVRWIISILRRQLHSKRAIWIRS